MLSDDGVTSPARQLTLLVAATLAAKGIVLAGALWGPPMLEMLGFHVADATQGSLLRRLCQWDCGWYARIMAGGYAEAVPERGSGEVNWVFFPAFPLIAQGLATVAGLPPLAAATLLNSCLSVVAALLLYSLARECFDHTAALATTLVFAFSPFSLYSTVPYTEALYNALSLGAVLLACRRRWLACGVCMALLTATRPTGILIMPAIAMVAWKLDVWADWRRELGGETVRFALCLLLCPLGLAAYMAFLALNTGDALAFTHAQRAWGRELLEPFGRLVSGLFGDCGYHRYGAVGGVLGLVGALYLWRLNAPLVGRPAALILFLTIFVASASDLNSLARYVGAFWPLYLVLGAWLGRSSRSRSATVAVCILCAGGLFGASTMWAHGWPILR